MLHKGFGQPPVVAALSALGLAHVSEFAFVIAGRAKTMKIISREVYYLLLGTTTLTLVLVPLLFALARHVLSLRGEACDTLPMHKHVRRTLE